jgi:hypothetical protein
MSVTINGTSGLVFNDASTQNTAATGFGFKNRIINGAMVIDQRNAGASVTPTTSSYTLDRMQAVMTQASKYSVQQNAGSVTPPTGFTNYLGVTSTSAYSLASGDVFAIRHYIEGFNTADLAWGTANASTVTLSFWVRSSLTGTFGGSIMNSSQARAYPFSYTINSANTWEQKSIIIAGDTTGTWLTNNGAGLMVNLSIGSGSTFSGTAGSWVSSNIWSTTGATSVVGTSGATFYITGVQLEKGSTATSFDYRPYGTELALCQRYYWKTDVGAVRIHGTGWAASTSSANGVIAIPVSMRSAPTLSTSGTAADYRIYRAASFSAATAEPTLTNATVQAAYINYTIGGADLTTNSGCGLGTNTNGFFSFSAEL